MDGQLTLEMLNTDGTPVSWNVATTRDFNELDQQHVAELLDAVVAAEFFTRPEPVIDVHSSTVAFRVRIAWDGRSIGEPNAAPALERVARAARACLRDRKVIALNSMPYDERQALLAALFEVDIPEGERWPD
ncbi:hypothetical protein [Sphingomonas lenta]|uniref:Uncharacterized protein n=1 Tax=Sphingomonas lenta TaxID=1141887 RepID=A0A2A2SHX7_9SPHN|nr:hypothetical protein [Sphingomonas lenta]PAX08877.1 hypothetical protein CKY28_05855 [Sphingomonas lenta]